MSVANTVVVKGDPLRFEQAAAAAVTPGHLVEETSSGTIQAHSTAKGSSAKLVAVEDDLQGKEITDAYATGNQVIYVAMYPGCEANMLLANGQSVSIGDALVSAGDGTLTAWADTSSADLPDPEQLICWAREAVDMSGSSGEDPSGRIQVRF